MNPSSSYPVPGFLWRLVAMLLALTGLILSIFLLTASWKQGSIAGCAPGSGCDKVLSSVWGYWLEMPVSLPAVGTYACVLGVLLHIGGSSSLERRRAAWAILLTLAGVITGAALWFIILQLMVIKAFCLWCMATHIVGLILSAMIAVWLLGPGYNPEAELSLSPNGRDARTVGLAAATVLAILITGQVLASPIQHRTVNQSGPASALDSGPGPQRRLTLLARVDPRQFPVLGSVDSPHLIISIYDYACPHCRIMHQYLEQVRQRYGSQVSILMMPVPLNEKCNPSIQFTDPGYEDSCELARLALAVWRAVPAKFEQFDQRLFAGERPPSAKDARQWARELVGQDALDKVLEDPWIAWRIGRHAAMYEVFSIERLPTLMVGRILVMGRPGKSEELFQLLEEQLNIKPLAK